MKWKLTEKISAIKIFPDISGLYLLKSVLTLLIHVTKAQQCPNKLSSNLISSPITYQIHMVTMAVLSAAKGYTSKTHVISLRKKRNF